MEKARILINKGLMDLNDKTKLGVADYKKESTHLDLILQSVQIPESGTVDADYLLKRQMLFVPQSGFKLNHKLITTTRIAVCLKLNNLLDEIFSASYNSVDQQFIIDVLFLFGDIDQVKKFYPLVSNSIAPSMPILMEIMCYGSVAKIGYVWQKGLLTKPMIDNLSRLAIMLSDNIMNSLFSKINSTPNINFELVLLSKNSNAIDKWIERYGTSIELNKDMCKKLLETDNLDLIGKFHIPDKYINELCDWCTDKDLIDVANYLKKGNMSFN